MTAGEAFYELDGDRAIPSEFTRGPWDAGSQHAGPPAALLGHAMETLPLGEEEMRIGRIAYEVLRPVPIGEWVCLAVTLPQGDGIGLADTALWDEKGPIGRATQTLLVAER